MENREDIITAIKTATRSNFALSLWVPVRRAGHILDAAFLYDMGNFTTVRMRPFASVLVEPRTGTLLEYRNAYVSDFADTEKYPLSLKIDYAVPSARTAAQQLALTARAGELYQAVRELAWRGGLTDEEIETAREYAGCFAKAVPNDLVVFYEALAPEFFSWLDSLVVTDKNFAK